MKRKLISLMLVMTIILSVTISFAGCGKTVVPQLRVNASTNFWEVSYDEGATWVSMEVKATGADGKDGQNGKDGIDGKDGKDGVDGVNGVDGKDGVNGTNGKDGKDGKDGENGSNGTNGVTPVIGTDGYWYIDGQNTGIYAGTSEAVTVTFKTRTGESKVTTTKGSKVSYYLPEPEDALHTFVNWYEDEDCTVAFNFNNTITADTTIYSKWNADAQYLTIGELIKTTNFGKASCFGTTSCFGSVYYRVLADDHKYYDGASGIANYLKGVFVEDEDGNVTVASSQLSSISYTPALTVINFASAFSSYEQYIQRNNEEMPEDIAKQKELAIKYFETVDDTADGYHTHSGTGGFTFPSMAVAVVALGSLMEQQETERFETLIKDAYDNVDAGFWNSAMYLTPFYQLCAHYDWYDLSGVQAELEALESLTGAYVYKYYAYGIDVANVVPELWNAYVEEALSDGTINSIEAKAFAYHYTYQLTGGNCWLGVYGSTYGIVDFT